MHPYASWFSRCAERQCTKCYLTVPPNRNRQCASSLRGHGHKQVIAGSSPRTANDKQIGSRPAEASRPLGSIIALCRAGIRLAADDHFVVLPDHSPTGAIELKDGIFLRTGDGDACALAIFRGQAPALDFTSCDRTPYGRPDCPMTEQDGPDGCAQIRLRTNTLAEAEQNQYCDHCSHGRGPVGRGGAMFITKDVMVQVAPKYHGHKAQSQKQIIAEVSKTIARTTNDYGITTFLRRAHFLAQVCTESDGFCTLHEYASGQEYEGRVKSLGNTHVGDGKRYKGRGLIQLTGRANYRHFGRALHLPLEEQPDLAADPAIAVRIACEFWKQKHINHFCDHDDIIHVTRRVNGGLNGIKQRTLYLARAKTALNGSIQSPNPPGASSLLAAQ